MKTGIKVSIALTALVLCLGLAGAATAEVINQDSEQAMIDSNIMIINGSEKMIAAEKIMKEAKRMAGDGQNLAKARQMMAGAERLLSEGEKMWEQGLEMADRQKQAQKQMAPIMTQRKNVNYESKIITIGMRIAEAMLAEDPKVSKKSLQTADGSEIYKGH